MKAVTMKKMSLMLVFLMLTISMYSQTPYEVFGHKGKVLETNLEKGGGIIELVNTDTSSSVRSLRFDFNTMKFYTFDRYYLEVTHGKIVPTVSKRWWSPDPLSSKYPGESPYSFVGNNPISYFDPYGLEKIAVLGGPDVMGEDENKFFNVGLKQVQDYLKETEQSGEQVTVILFNGEGYIEKFKEELQTISGNRTVQVIQIKMAFQLTEYFNTKATCPTNDNNPRIDDPITGVSFIGHGYASSFRPDYGIVLKGQFNQWDISEANQLNSNAFKCPEIYFYSCRAALAVDEDMKNPNNLAQVVSAKTQGVVYAWKERTEYSGIYNHERLSEIDEFSRKLKSRLWPSILMRPATDYPIGSLVKGSPAIKLMFINGIRIN